MDQIFSYLKNCTADLGFTIASNQAWAKHIETKLAKCRRVFKYMHRTNRFSTSSPRKKLLHHSLVVSILLYGSPVWALSVTYLKRWKKTSQPRWVILTSLLFSAGGKQPHTAMQTTQRLSRCRSQSCNEYPEHQIMYSWLFVMFWKPKKLTLKKTSLLDLLEQANAHVN